MRPPQQDMVRVFSFASLAKELRKERERHRLENEADKLLRRVGSRRDGRPRTERSESVRLVLNSNGPRR